VLIRKDKSFVLYGMDADGFGQLLIAPNGMKDRPIME